MFRYEALPGFFAQDDPLADPAVIGAVPARFGLLDSSETRWSNLTSKLRELNTIDASSSYKLIFFGRHGQGYHNVAETKYGTKAWDDYWAKLYGDGELIWGPDPELTSVGKDQAADVSKIWTAEIAAHIPLPDRLYCSPMTRAMQTNVITFADLPLPTVVVLENCREETRSPHFDIEAGFTEEDELWDADVRETAAHAVLRAESVLDRIFREDTNTLVVSITAHGGIINGFLRALGRSRYALPTGGVVPVVVKATKSA
ncbi:histidine phosphatase superfamily [Mycena olivaceomarginata]|nr:histidine phosphatase superfamily [Mycena olivaceomarginata]